MKLVIDIDEKDYEFIKSVRSIMKNSDTFQRISADLFDAVKNSEIVLPEGHGDLIDRDALIQKQFVPNVGWELVDLDDLKTAPTVIPADK